MAEDLGIAHDAVERGPQLMAHTGHVAGLGHIGGFGHLLGTLQLHIGALVRFDLLAEQLILAIRLILGEMTALVGEHHPPCRHRGKKRKQSKRVAKRAAQQSICLLVETSHLAGLIVVDAQHHADEQHQTEQHQQVLTGAEIDPPRNRIGQQQGEHALQLRSRARGRLAQITATRFQRTAQRADIRAIGRTTGHILGLEAVLAHDTAHHLPRLARRLRLPRNIEAATRQPRNQRGAEHPQEQRDEGRVGLCERAEPAQIGTDRHRRRDQHGPRTDWIDVVQVGALELDMPGRKTQRFVDHQIRNQRADPGHCDIGVQPEHRLEGMEHAKQHQQGRDRDIEHQPHHPSRVAVRDSGEKIRPRERTRIGVGHIDLDL